MRFSALKRVSSVFTTAENVHCHLNYLQNIYIFNILINCSTFDYFKIHLINCNIIKSIVSCDGDEYFRGA